MWPSPSITGIALTFVGMVAVACAEQELPELPEPPEGAELVLELGDLEVYKAFDGQLCAGTLRRIELHVDALAELFEMEPPRARVVLYAETDAIQDVCPYTSGRTRGCALWWGANALPVAVAHELVHVFVFAATNQTRTRPFIQEGLAWALEGTRPAWNNEVSLVELEDMLAIRSSFDLPQRGERHFFAWAIDEYGLSAVLDAHIRTSKVETDEEFGLAFAQSFGFESLADLHAEYDATSALRYPHLPHTTRVFTAEELALGVDLDTSCTGAYTEGPSDSEITTIARLEIPEPGEYDISYPPIPLEDFWQLYLQYTEPFYAEQRDLNIEIAQQCPFITPVPRFLFLVPGQYEFTISRPVGGESFQTKLSSYYRGGDECSRP
jgi:hypothetical protein